jgi:hypothetical protein
MDNFDLKKYLAEGRLLKENTNPIWTIEASEDDADISDAGLEYIRAVGTIIDKALPDMSIEDMIASMEVINNFWYDEARKNAKGSEPEEIKVSAIDFADSVIEHYKDVLMDKDIKENKITNNKMDNFDLRKYLAEGKLFEENDEPFKSKKYIKIDNSEYYVDENGNVKLSLNFPYKFNRSHIYNTPREEYIDKNNWKEKVDPNFPIMKVINNVPTARYEFIEYPSGDKELLVKTNIEDLKKYEDGNYTLK